MGERNEGSRVETEPQAKQLSRPGKEIFDPSLTIGQVCICSRIFAVSPAIRRDPVVSR
jgi:hypothetical protein|tara:strand:- start:123 stop:296 length:174 start_codon:yes stop_codon:yes gene_type:complete